MPYRRSYYDRAPPSALRGTTKKPGFRRRRRTTMVSKVRYQAPTARHQRRQILTNARMVSKLYRSQLRHRVWSDWQYTGGQSSINSGEWVTIRLTDFTLWENVLRADAAVSRKAHTFINRMQLNLRFNMQDSYFVGFNVFVVSPRKFATNVDPFVTQPILFQDYIQPSQDEGFNVRLNSGLYKVHFSRYFTLTKNYLGAPPANENVGDPDTTWRKMQANIPMRLSVTNPVARTGNADTWLEVPFNDLPYYGKYYLMILPSWLGPQGGSPPFISWDALYTTINSS